MSAFSRLQILFECFFLLKKNAPLQGAFLKHSTIDVTWNSFHPNSVVSFHF